jgi:hypothetical protein
LASSGDAFQFAVFKFLWIFAGTPAQNLTHLLSVQKFRPTVDLNFPHGFLCDLRLELKQSFVNRTDMLNSEVAVRDTMPSLRRLAVSEAD